MKRINTEILVSSLLVTGFDKVDSCLYTLILGLLGHQNVDMMQFEFVDETFSQTFTDYVDFDGTVFKFRKGFDLNTKIGPLEQRNIPLKDKLHINRDLVNYFQQLDFCPIVLKKVSNLGGVESISEEIYNYLFSDKEKEIIDYNVLSVEHNPKLEIKK